MTIFLVVTASPNSQALGANIARQFQSDAVTLAPNQWLVSADTSAASLCEKLGIVKGSDFGSTLVVAISSYFGLHSTETWDWIKRKWEAGPHGQTT